MTSRFILYTSSSTFCTYKKESSSLAAWMRHSVQHHCSSIELLPSFPRPNPLRARRVGRAGLQNHHLHLRHLLGYVSDQIFGEHHRDCSLFMNIFMVMLLIGSSSLSSPQWTPEGLRGEHLPASTVVHDFDQHTMTTRVNGATSALSMGPSAGYNPFLGFVKFNIFSVMVYMLFMFISATIASSNITHMHIHVVTNLLWFFWIKFNMKMPQYLTPGTVLWPQLYSWQA